MDRFDAGRVEVRFCRAFDEEVRVGRRTRWDRPAAEEPPKLGMRGVRRNVSDPTTPHQLDSRKDLEKEKKDAPERVRRMRRRFRECRPRACAAPSSLAERVRALAVENGVAELGLGEVSSCEFDRRGVGFWWGRRALGGEARGLLLPLLLVVVKRLKDDGAVGRVLECGLLELGRRVGDVGRFDGVGEGRSDCVVRGSWVARGRVGKVLLVLEIGWVGALRRVHPLHRRVGLLEGGRLSVKLGRRVRLLLRVRARRWTPIAPVHLSSYFRPAHRLLEPRRGI